MNEEPGIFVSFEERAESIRQNALSLGWDLKRMEEDGLIAIVDAKPDPGAGLTGEFTFAGLFAILDGLNGKLKAMSCLKLCPFPTG